MARRIRVLADSVANQIAAGEAVERPASVVKELVENAMDARAKRIEIAIERGGKRLIRVSDDGIGMGREDAILCFDRHATSKIEVATDLTGVQTFGFRGEAIPSIASPGAMLAAVLQTENERYTIVEQVQVVGVMLSVLLVALVLIPTARPKKTWVAPAPTTPSTVSPGAPTARSSRPLPLKSPTASRWPKLQPVHGL